MAQNHIQKGDVVTCVAPVGGVAGGAPVKIGNIIGIANKTTLDGETFELFVTDVWDVAALSGLVIVVGDTLYWDDTNKEFNKTSTGNTKAGFAVTASPSGTTSVHIRLTPGVD